MNKKLLSLPFIFWSAMFVIVPLCMVFYYGLTDKSGAFTLDNILAIATAEHSKALWEALKLSVISTVICLLLAYPLAMILCNMNVNQNSFLVLIFILPMWMSSIPTGKTILPARPCRLGCIAAPMMLSVGCLTGGITLPFSAFGKLTGGQRSFTFSTARRLCLFAIIKMGSPT